MPELVALREDFQRRKAGLLQPLETVGASVRGVHGVLQRLARQVDLLLAKLWRIAAFPEDFTLAAVGGYGRGGGVRTTGQGTGTAWSREPRSPPSVGTTWRSQKGLAFGLKALTAPPLC